MLSVVGSAGVLAAQVIREPVLLFEPGVVTINAASAPLPTGSSTGLNLRFLAEDRSAQPDISVRRFDSDLERERFRPRTMSALEIHLQYASPPT